MTDNVANGEQMEHKRALFFWGVWPELNSYPFMSTEKLIVMTGYNTGNLVYSSAIYSHLDMVKTMNGISDDKFINIFTCANQLGAHSDMSSEVGRIIKDNKPMLAIGLGAQAQSDIVPELNKGTLDWVRSIAERAPVSNFPNITLRGHFTKRVLEHYGLGNAGIVLGCPSLFTAPIPNLGQKIINRLVKEKRVAVLAGHSWHKNLYEIERSLVNLVSLTKGAYIVQSDEPMLQLARGEGFELSDDVIKKYREFLMPSITKESFLKWWMRYGHVFFNVDNWLEFYKHYDFAIGARIHGIILALQAGIPGVCIAHDARTMELCQVMKIPFVTPDRIEHGVKPEILDYLFESFDPDEFDKNRKKLWQKYIHFLHTNGLHINKNFLSLFKDEEFDYTTKAFN